MTFELRNMTFQAVDPAGEAGLVAFFAGDGPDAQQSKLWVAGRVASQQISMKSLALNQLSALHAARDLIDSEIARLTPPYRQAEQAQR